MVLFFPSGLERLKIAKMENDSHRERTTRCVFVSPSFNFMHADYADMECTYWYKPTSQARSSSCLKFTHMSVQQKPKNLRTSIKKKKKKSVILPLKSGTCADFSVITLENQECK